MAKMLKAEDFLSLRLAYKAEQAEGELPAMIERSFPQGRMCDHYFVRPNPALLDSEEIRALNAAAQDEKGAQPFVVAGVLFSQRPDGQPWQVILHEAAMAREIDYDMDCAEFTSLLAANKIILPGEPGFTMI